MDNTEWEVPENTAMFKSPASKQQRLNDWLIVCEASGSVFLPGMLSRSQSEAKPFVAGWNNQHMQAYPTFDDTTRRSTDPTTARINKSR